MVGISGAAPCLTTPYELTHFILLKIELNKKRNPSPPTNRHACEPCPGISLDSALWLQTSPNPSQEQADAVLSLAALSRMVPPQTTLEVQGVYLESDSRKGSGVLRQGSKGCRQRVQ